MKKYIDKCYCRHCKDGESKGFGKGIFISFIVFSLLILIISIAC